jgi:histone acetyltransferase MYST1
LFLEDKALFYSVENFTLYVIRECYSRGAHFAGSFSRQLDQIETNSAISCITILRPYQRKGYARLLISFGYEIAKRAKMIGGPERPLSDLGALAFNSYWKDVLMPRIFTYGERIASFADRARLTNIARVDIISVLTELEIKVQYKGSRKQLIEFDMIKVGEVYQARRQRINQRKMVSPDLLI